MIRITLAKLLWAAMSRAGVSFAEVRTCGMPYMCCMPYMCMLCMCMPYICMPYM